MSTQVLPSKTRCATKSMPRSLALTRFALTRVAVLAVAFLAACGGSGGGAEAIPVGEGPAVGLRLRHDDLINGRGDIVAALDHGRRLFLASFNDHDGAGRPATTGTGGSRMRRAAPQNFNRLSGPDAGSCVACHNKPFVGGAGDNVANVFVLAQDFPHLNFDGGEGDRFADHGLRDVGNERNTIGMFGAGFVELAAREMSVALQATRDAARDEALATRRAVTKPLVAKGISFGKVTARADGSFDLSGVEGVDQDLIVKPFHQKGVVPSLRVFTNNALNHHHGMQSTERFGIDSDPDGDGVKNELLDGDVTALTLFQATLPVPGRVLPGERGAAREAATRGEAQFTSIGCASCHTPELQIRSSVFVEPGPFNPQGNLRQGDAWREVQVDLLEVGSGPKLAREADGSVRLPLYSDLKRHDMGPMLNDERVVQAGVPTSVFLTPRLWGVANQGPWLHHGRATTLDEAIRMHDGEGKAARDAYLAMRESDRLAIVEFLKTLQVLPEDSKDLVVIGPESRAIGDRPVVEDHMGLEVFASAPTPDDLIDRLLVHGKRLFDGDFNHLDGAGRPKATGTGAARDERLGFESFNRISGPDANSCMGCHNQPRSGGGGDNVANVFVLAQAHPHVGFDRQAGDGFKDLDLDNVGNERNTLGMWGAGFVELLARELSSDLLRQRDEGIATAKREQREVTVALRSKGISFGKLVIDASGKVDAHGVEGIDPDLVIKPFHQKGVVASLREFTNNALNHHHGMQSRERFGPGDHDGDGHHDELLEGDVTAMTLYQAALAVPGRVLPTSPSQRAAIEAGERIFAAIDCTRCHVPELVLDNPVFTEPGPFNPKGNLQPKDVPFAVAVDLTRFGEAPRLPRENDGSVRVPVYSDFKRHDLGPLCNNEKLQQAGVATGLFLTRKLWGFASEAPYLHHGRATTIREAIEMHGGEAEDTRRAFRELSKDQQAMLLDFLASLQVVQGTKLVEYR